MKSLHENWKGLATSGLFAIPYFVGAFIFFLKPDGNIVEGFGLGLLGASLLVLGAVIMAIPLARFVAELSGSLFLPAGRWKRPLPIYSRPRAFRARKEYREAFQAYDELSLKYPQELIPYLEMLEIAVKALKEPSLAYPVYSRGMKSLRNRKYREHLARFRDELIGRPVANRP